MILAALVVDDRQGYKASSENTGVNVAAKNAKSKATGSGRRTVASLGAELDALKAEVAQLNALVAKLSRQNGDAIANAAVAAAPPAPDAGKKEVDVDVDPMDAVHNLLRQMFTICKEPLDEDDIDAADEMFVRFSHLVHSDRKGTSMLNQSLRNYTWSQLRKKADIYLDDPDDVGSYTVTRSSPENVGKRTSRVKLFLRARTRMPTPITLRRDEKDGDGWRIETSSL